LSDVVGPVNVPLVIAILLASSSTTSTPNSILMVIGLELVGLDDGDEIVVVNVAPTACVAIKQAKMATSILKVFMALIS
jgi:hypothetical protein